MPRSLWRLRRRRRECDGGRLATGNCLEVLDDEMMSLRLCVALVLAFVVPVAAPAADSSLEELVARLQDGDSAVRQKALENIGSWKASPKEIVPHVIRLLKDPNYRVRASAAHGLGNLQNALPDLGTRFPECIPQLTLILSDRDPEDEHQFVRRGAAYALRHLGSAAKLAVPALLKIAVDQREAASVRTEAVQALGEIGHASPEVVEALANLLDDPARINGNYPTIGTMAVIALGRFKANPEATRILIERLRLPDVSEREVAAAVLGTAGVGSPKAEKVLLDLLDDRSAAVQKAALSSLAGINDTYAFFFRYNVSSREVSEKRQALLQEIRRDAARKAAFAKILAARLRLGKGHDPERAKALRMLVELDAREYLPMLREQFNELEKKTVYLESHDLRMQLLITLARWLPDEEAVPFLIGVDSDSGEAPQVRFRALVLLCEQGDERSLSHIVEQHSAQADGVEPLITIDALQETLDDRRLYVSEREVDGLEAVGPDELARIQKGIQLAQHFYGLQERGAIRELSLAKVHVHEGKIKSMHFRLTAPSEGWSFDLRKKGGLWLPCSFRMEHIQ